MHYYFQSTWTRRDLIDSGGRVTYHFESVRETRMKTERARKENDMMTSKLCVRDTRVVAGRVKHLLSNDDQAALNSALLARWEVYHSIQQLPRESTRTYRRLRTAVRGRNGRARITRLLSPQIYACHTGTSCCSSGIVDLSNISFILIHPISTYEQIP